MTSPVRMENVSKAFGRHEALRALSLSVPEGGAYALLGANGAGKSTTLKILMNILRPDSGAAFVLGENTRQLRPSIFALIGYVAEQQQLPSRPTVGRYLEYLRAFYPTWDRQLEASICQRLGLPLERRIGELSHGMRMKAALAAALPFRPRVLVLDEPFSGLDPLVRDEFMEGLLGQAGELTLLISSQELPEIEPVATHVGFMDRGTLLFEEPIELLQSRMREVRVVFEATAMLPTAWPREWLQPARFGNVLTFIDTRHDAATLAPRLTALVGAPRQIDASPVPLRTVFTALARAARDGVVP